jgi:hypothetical protein
LVLTGCGDDPLGPDNRMALLALGQCEHELALQLTDNALERGSPPNVHRALLLRAAILRDLGDAHGERALYPRIDEAWRGVKRRELKPARRERDIQMFIDVARNERRARGLEPGCNVASRQSSQP